MVFVNLGSYVAGCIILHMAMREDGRHAYFPVMDLSKCSLRVLFHMPHKPNEKVRSSLA